MTPTEFACAGLGSLFMSILVSPVLAQGGPVTLNGGNNIAASNGVPSDTPFTGQATTTIQMAVVVTTILEPLLSTVPTTVAGPVQVSEGPFLSSLKSGADALVGADGLGVGAAPTQISDSVSRSGASNPSTQASMVMTTTTAAAQTTLPSAASGLASATSLPTASSTPGLSPGASAGIAIAITLTLALIGLLLGLCFYRRRRQTRPLLKSTVSNDDEPNWNAMLKPVSTPTGSRFQPPPPPVTGLRFQHPPPPVKKKPKPYRLETDFPPQLSKQSSLSHQSPAMTPDDRFIPKPPSKQLSFPREPPSATSTDRFVGNPFDAEIFEMPGSAVSAMTGESPGAGTVLELEGCTPVERNGRFVWPSPRLGQDQSQWPERSRSTKSTKSSGQLGRSLGRSNTGSRSSVLSLLRRAREDDPPAVPSKDAVVRSVALRK